MVDFAITDFASLAHLLANATKNWKYWSAKPDKDRAFDALMTPGILRAADDGMRAIQAKYAREASVLAEKYTQLSDARQRDMTALEGDLLAKLRQAHEPSP